MSIDRRRWIGRTAWSATFRMAQPWRKIIDELGDKHGRLDVLVNNAGITKDGLMLRMSDEDFDSVIDTNLKSAFVAIRAGARMMMRSKTGRIINISSVAGVVGNAGQANYASSKAGLIGLSKSGCQGVERQGNHL